MEQAKKDEREDGSPEERNRETEKGQMVQVEGEEATKDDLLPYPGIDADGRP
jgi:hypothetical protein